MRHPAVSILVVGLLVVSGGVPALGSNELELGTATANQGALASVPLTLSTTDEVQGLTAAFEWDAAVGAGEDLVRGPAIASADLVVTRVEADYMVLGVVVDQDGTPPSALAPGNDQLVATAKIRVPADLSADKTSSIRFVDFKYATVAGGPTLENLVTVGGLSIAKKEGLTLTEGSLQAKLGALQFVYKIENGTATSESECGTARVLMDSTGKVEGYEVALKHPKDDLNLDAIDVGSAATSNGADFTSKEILPDGGTVGVVMDLAEPFQGNTIAPGENLELAVYRYCCKSRPQSGPAEVHALTFVDGELGTPAKDNVVVAAGTSYPADTRDGSFACPPPGNAEVCDDGVDNDGDGLVDCADPDCAQAPNCTGELAYGCGAPALGAEGQTLAASGDVGGTANVCFYYRSVKDAIQGVSIATCTDCAQLRAKEGTFSIAGTIVQSVGAEYVTHQVDTDPNDGDGCELIIGILVDALPPFDGAVLPRSEAFLKLGCIDFDVANDPALVGKCVDVQYCDGADGPGKVPVRNLVSVDNFSKAPQLRSCQVCIGTGGTFFRGDCNFSNEDFWAVDIADAASTVSFLFGQGALKFDPPCLDACDSNDDGRIDLADATYLLKFLFEIGPFPPAPGPGFDENIQATPRGKDPTGDSLGCQGN